MRLVLLAIITLSICAAATLCAVFSYNGIRVDDIAYATATPTFDQDAPKGLISDSGMWADGETIKLSDLNGSAFAASENFSLTDNIISFAQTDSGVNTAHLWYSDFSSSIAVEKWYEYEVKYTFTYSTWRTSGGGNLTGGELYDFGDGVTSSANIDITYTPNGSTDAAEYLIGRVPFNTSKSRKTITAEVTATYTNDSNADATFTRNFGVFAFKSATTYNQTMNAQLTCIAQVLTRTKLSPTKPTADTTKYTYTGNPLTYRPVGYDPAKMILASDSDSLTQTNAGAYTIKILPNGTPWDDNTTDAVEFTFTIGKATPNITPTYTAKTYVSEGLPDDLLFTTTSGVAGTISWDPATVIAGTHDYGWTFVPDAAHANNFNNATGKEPLTYQEAGIKGVSVTPKAGDAGKIYDIFTLDEVKDCLDVKIEYQDGRSVSIISSQFTIISGYDLIATSAGGTATLMVQEDMSGKSYFATVDVNVIQAQLQNLTVQYTDPSPRFTYPVKMSDVINRLTVRANWDCYSTLYVVSKSDITLDKTDADIKAGANTVTVAYKTKTATFTVNVDKGTYNMNGVTLANDTVTYDGSAKSLTISGNLPTGVTVAYTYSKNGAPLTEADVKDAGVYTVTAAFTGDADNYNAISDMTATLTIDKATFDMSGITFADRQFTRDGNAKNIEISGTLPAGVTVTYEYTTSDGAPIAASDVKETGTYTVTAKFNHTNPNYNIIPDRTVTLEITDKKEYDTSEAGVNVTGATKESNGKYFTEYSPDGVVTFEITGDVKDEGGNVASSVTRTLKYEMKLADGSWTEVDASDIKDAGEYRVTVEYINTDDEYMTPNPEIIELVVDKATVPESDIVFTDGSGEGNGLDFEIDVGEELPEIHIDASSLPAGVTVTETVSYEKKNENGNWEPASGTPTDAGEYRVKFETEHVNPNYKQLPAVYASLVIKKITYPLPDVKFYDAEEDYDGTVKKLEITGSLPVGVTVKYTYCDEDGNLVAATDVKEIGKYIVTATFNHNDPNYDNIEPMIATLEIVRRTVLVPAFKGAISYTGEELIPGGEDFGGFDERLMTIVEAKSDKGKDVGTYYVVFALLDPEHYRWEDAAESSVAFGYLLYEEATLDAGERRAPWEIKKAIITATAGEGLPGLSSESYKGGYDGIIEYKYYADEACTEEVSPDALVKNNKYYVRTVLTESAAGNFELADSGKVFEYTYVGEPTFWDNVMAFFAANWMWFAIGLGVLLFLILLIVLAHRRKKKEELRRQKEEEKEERRRKEEAEERRLERESRMMMQQPVMPQMMPMQMQQPAQAAASEDAIARMEAKFDKLLEQQQSTAKELAAMAAESKIAERVAEARAEATAAAKAESAQQAMAAQMIAMQQMLNANRAETSQQLSTVRTENLFLRGNANAGQNGVTLDSLGGLLVAALHKYATDGQGMPAISEEKLALPESNIVNNVVPGAITTTTTTTTVDASGSRTDGKTTGIETIPNAEGLFNRRGKGKNDGYDVDNFYNFFDESEKKD